VGNVLVFGLDTAIHRIQEAQAMEFRGLLLQKKNCINLLNDNTIWV
jgi:hypothetical protein